MALQVHYDDLRRELGLFLSIGRDPANWTSVHVEDVAAIIRAALRRFYWPLPVSPDQPRHIWSFLAPKATLATISGQQRYDLPEDFHSLETDGFVAPVVSDQPKVARVAPETIEALHAQAERSGAPQYFAIRHKPVGGYEVVFYPTPDAAISLTYQYSVTPDELSSDNPLPLGGAQHSQTIIEACLAEAEKTMQDEEGVHEKRFRELLIASILLDQQMAQQSFAQPWPFEHASTSLQVTKAYLKRLIGDQLGHGPHPATWTHPQAQRVKLVLETGLRKFYHPTILPGERYSHQWAFLRPTVHLTLISGQFRYDLPEDFAMFEGEMFYAPGAAVLYRPVRLVSEHQIQRQLQRTEAGSRPTIFAYRIKSPDAAAGTAYEVLFWPVPEQDYELAYRYSINPDTLKEEAALPFGGQPHMQTIIEACLAAAEESMGTPGVHTVAFLECLRASVSHDRQVNCPPTLGTTYDPSDTPLDPYASWHDHDEEIVTYNGVRY